MTALSGSTAPWVTCAALAAIVVLASLAAIITCVTVRKARAEDLPEILAGLSLVIEALSAFLPWRRTRDHQKIRRPQQPSRKIEPHSQGRNSHPYLAGDSDPQELPPRQAGQTISTIKGPVLVHQLVQTIIRSQFDDHAAGRWAGAAAVLVEAALPVGPDHNSTWQAYAVLLPHARAVLDLTGDSLWNVIQYLDASGSYTAALDLTKRITDALKSNDAYGPGHPSILTARHNLASFIGKAGDAILARDELAALLPVREQVLGTEHPDTIATRHSLAYWVGEAGNAVRGES